MRRPPRSLRPFALVATLAFAALALGACGVQSTGQGTATADGETPSPIADAAGRPLIEQALSSAPVAAADAGTPGEVDYTCTTDADCAVKDVGSCCGYAPACVNTNSPTFPEQVKAECAKNDMQSVCGFRDIQGCVCVEGRCEAGPATSGEVVR